MMRALLLPLLLLGLAAGLAGCDVYARPNVPVPDSFQAHLLDGTPLTAEALKGKPTVIGLWVPG